MTNVEKLRELEALEMVKSQIEKRVQFENDEDVYKYIDSMSKFDLVTAWTAERYGAINVVIVYNALRMFQNLAEEDDLFPVVENSREEEIMLLAAILKEVKGLHDDFSLFLPQVDESEPSNESNQSN